MNFTSDSFLNKDTSLRKAFQELRETLYAESVIDPSKGETLLFKRLNNLGFLVGSYDDFFDGLSRAIAILAVADLEFAHDELAKLYGKCEIGDAITGALNAFVMLLQRGEHIRTPDRVVKAMLQINSLVITEDDSGRVGYINHRLQAPPYDEAFTEEPDMASGDSIESLLRIPAEHQNALCNAPDVSFISCIYFFTRTVPCIVHRKRFRKNERIYFVEFLDSCHFDS